MRLSPKPLFTTLAALALLLSASSCTDRSRPHQSSPGLAAEFSGIEHRLPGALPPGAADTLDRGDRAAARHTVRGTSATNVRTAYRASDSPGSDSLSAAHRASGGPRNAWEAVRLRMTIVPARPEVSSLRAFRRKLRRYHGNQRFFDHLGREAAPWLYHVTEHLEARGMPGELALLPAVESGYDNAAESSQNAAGLWQILPTTARDLKLPRSRWYDARYDVPAATPAALDYLASLRTAFNDDWLLAVAAYNCGPGNVKRAVRQAGLKIETAAYPDIERHLPPETRGHVARWLVLSEIVAAPRLHNVQLESIPLRPYFAEVSVAPSFHLEAAAKLVGLPPSELARLNSGLKRGIVAPDGPYRVLIPAGHADRFNRKFGDLHALAAAVAIDRRRYRIRPGDTLGSIARAYAVPVKTLMAVNDLDSHLIRAGRYLWVPATDRMDSGETVAVATHVVAPGESLWSIAKRYGTSVGSLRSWNLLAPGTDLLRPGQKLRILREG